MAIDRVTLEILENHSRAAAESMGYTLFRTAHSAFVKETQDFSTGLMTPAGECFATPNDIGAVWFTTHHYGGAIDAIDDYAEGDICLTNDPYSGYVATHTPDIHLWKPVFHEGEIACFVGNHIHHTDVGGAVPASLSRKSTDVHQEGIRIRPAKLISGGEVNQQLRDILLANVRAPDQNWGDLKAQIAAVNTGERKVHEMIAKFGFPTFRDGIEEVLDYAEAQAREVVRSLPDGEYYFADYIDEDSVDGNPCRLALNLIIDGDSVVFDLSGCDPQPDSALNMPTGNNPRHALLMAGLVWVLYSLDPTILMNAGTARLCRADVPEGSVLNPLYPAAVGMRTLSVVRLIGVVIGAFAQAAPDRLPASPSSGGPVMNINTFDTVSGRRVVASIDPMAGGAGGNPVEDGTDGSGAHLGALRNTPVEVNETEVPFHIVRYGMVRDSGGAGRYRGGLGAELEFEAWSPNTTITARNLDRTRFCAWGVQHGHTGAPGSFLLNPGTNHEFNYGNTDVVTVGPGDVVRIVSDGGGGWGSPLDRPADDVLMDVRRGFVSIEGAARDYGVVIEAGAVDLEATAAKRIALVAEQPTGFYDYGAEREAFEAVWTRANYAVLTEIFSALPIHWRFFVKRRIFALVDDMAEADRKGDGTEVHAAFARVVDDHPQLADAIAKPPDSAAAE